MKWKADNEFVKVNGRTLYRNDMRVLGYTATGVTFRFKGKKASAVLLSDVEGRTQDSLAWMAVFVNDQTTPAKRFPLKEAEAEYTLYESDQEAEVTITLMKYSEVEYAKCLIKEIITDSDTLLAPPQQKKRKMLIIGDSITCGYGVEGDVEDEIFCTAKENPSKAYSLLTAQELNAEYQIVAWNGKGVISAYIGEERDEPDPQWRLPFLYDYTDGGSEQDYYKKEEKDWEKWDHQSYQADIVTVYLGTNDASYTREIPQRDQEFIDAYKVFLGRIHQTQPQAAILCMLGTMDQRLCPATKRAVEEYAKNHKEVQIEYLELPAQSEEDGLGTFWHPMAITHRKVADKVVAKIKEMMRW